MVSEVKKFARDMVSAIDVSLDRLDRLDAHRRLLLTSQLVGSIDTLSSLLLLFGRIAPKARRFVKGGRRQLAQLRTDARRMRSAAFAELFQVEEPADETEQPEPEPQPEAEAPPTKQLAVIDMKPSNDEDQP